VIGEPDVAVGYNSYLAQFHQDGSLDESFVPPLAGYGSAEDVDTLANGQFMVVGSITTGPNIMRLNPNGSRDTTLSLAVNGSVRVIRVLSDGSVLIGGEFTQVNGQTRNRLARLLPNGVLD